MGKKHAVIIIPGLGDEVKKHEWLTKGWRKYGLDPIVFSMNWYDDESFITKRNSVYKLLTRLNKEYERVSILGTSAGGSVAFNLLFIYPNIVYKAVNICGRLRLGIHRGLLRYFNYRGWTSRAFKESVLMFDKNKKNLSLKFKQRMMTVRPKHGDELVPANSIILDGAINITIPTIEHVLSIALALSVFSKPIILFLKDK